MHHPDSPRHPRAIDLNELSDVREGQKNSISF